MLSPKQSSPTNNYNNKNAKKGGQVVFGQKNYREKMVTYLRFCFPKIDVVELRATLKECTFEVDKAVKILEKISQMTVKIDFVTWLKIISFNLKKIKNITKPKSTTQNTNEPETNTLKSVTTCLQVPENISREEKILSIIEENQINIENSALMQLLAKPVVCIKRLPLSTIKSILSRKVNKKLVLSPLLHKKVNIKTINSSVNNKAKEVSPRKRKTKSEDKIRVYKKRKTFADINEINEELNSVLDDDILQSLSSEKIFKKVEYKPKSCDETIVLSPAVISQENTCNIGKNESIIPNQGIKIKIKIDHTTGNQAVFLIGDYNNENSQSQNNGQTLSDSDGNSSIPPSNRPQLQDANNIHETTMDELSSEETSSNRIIEQETSSPNDENTDKSINNLQTSQEILHSNDAVDLNHTEMNNNMRAVEDNICREDNLLTINQETDSINISKSVDENNSFSENVSTTVSNKLNSTDTVNVNYNQEALSTDNNYAKENSVVTNQESQQTTDVVATNYTQECTMTNYNSEYLPMANQTAVVKVACKGQQKSAPSPKSSKGNFMLNVTVEQAADTMLPLIKCLIAVTEKNNSEMFHKSIAVISNSLKYYLSKVCIHSFNIYSFINILTSKMPEEHKSPDLDKKIVDGMFKTLSITTDKPVRVSEFLLRFYTDLREMRNDPRYALDPLAIDSAVNSNNNDAQKNKNRYYDGHTYQPVDNVFLTDVTQISKKTRTSVLSNNNNSGKASSNQINVGNYSNPSHSTFSGCSYSCLSNINQPTSAFPNNPLNLANNNNCSAVSYPNDKTMSNQPVAFSTTSTISSVNNGLVFPVQSQLSNVKNVLTNSQNEGTFSVPTFPTHSNLNISATTNVQKQLPSAYNTLAFNNNCIQSSETLSAPSIPHSPSESQQLTHTVSGCSTQKQVPSGIQNSGTFIPHSTSNTLPFNLRFNTVSRCNTQNQLSHICNNNGTQNKETFLVPSTPHSDSKSNTLPLNHMFHTVSRCNFQNQLSSCDINGTQNEGTFSTIPHSTSNAVPLSLRPNTVSRCNTQHNQLSSCYNNNGTQNERTFSVPTIPHSTSTALSSSLKPNTVSKCNTQHNQLSSCYNNNGTQNERPFSVPTISHSTSTAVSSSIKPNRVSKCNTQHNQLSSCYNNNGTQNEATFSVPTISHSTSTALSSSIKPNRVSKCNTQNNQLFSCYNNNSTQNEKTFSVPTISHSISTVVTSSIKPNIVSKCKTQQNQLSSCYNNNGTQNEKTFSVPTIPHSTSTAGSSSIKPNRVSKCNTQHNQLSSCYNNNGTQNEATFSVPTISHSTSTAGSSSIKPNRVSKCNTQHNQLSSCYNNNGTQNEATFSVPTISHSTSTALSSSIKPNRVSKCTTQHNQLCSCYNNNGTQNERTFLVPTISHSTSTAVSSSIKPNRVSKCNTQHNQLSSCYNNNGTQNERTFSVSIPYSTSNMYHSASSIDSVSPFKHSAFNNNANHTQVCLNNVTSVSSFGTNVFPTGVYPNNKRLFPLSRQALRQTVPQNCVGVNSGGKDDPIASLKSYEINMNLIFPNMNENCTDTMEFIDLDDYYGNSNNK